MADLTPELVGRLRTPVHSVLPLLLLPGLVVPFAGRVHFARGLGHALHGLRYFTTSHPSAIFQNPGGDGALAFGELFDRRLEAVGDVELGGSGGILRGGQDHGRGRGGNGTAVVIVCGSVVVARRVSRRRVL